MEKKDPYLHLVPINDPETYLQSNTLCGTPAPWNRCLLIKAFLGSPHFKQSDSICPDCKAHPDLGLYALNYLAHKEEKGSYSGRFPNLSDLANYRYTQGV